VSARTLSRRLAAALLLAALALPVLEGCGKKPAHLDPPEGSGPDASKFPLNYPSASRDPLPTGAQPQAGKAGVAAPPPAPEPMVPVQSYPPIIRPENITPNSAIALPGQTPGVGGGSGWTGSTTRGQ